jgi:acetoacetate decarboxylase
MDRTSRPHPGLPRACPVAELPVLEFLSASHLIADLTLGLGTVVHDYLTDL